MRWAGRLIRALAGLTQLDGSKLKLPQAALFKCTLVFHENISAKMYSYVYFWGAFNRNCRLVGNKLLF